MTIPILNELPGIPMVNRILLITLLPLLASCNNPNPASNLEGGELISTESVLAAAIADSLIPGAVLLVQKSDETVFHKSFGLAVSAGPDRAPRPMTPSHVFDLASLTKVFATTLGIMHLVDKGEVDLNAPVKTYIPEFTSASKDSVTVRHLLTHTGGLHQWKPVYYHARNAAEARGYVTQLDLAFPVGQQRRYSDLGFMMLGYIVHEVSGLPISEYVSTNIYQPLGLARTGFNPVLPDSIVAATSFGNPFEKKMVADDTFGYVCDEDPDSFTDWRAHMLQGEVNDGNAFYAQQGVAGHAGLFSNASEVATLLALIRNRGSLKENQILTPGTVDTFLTPTGSGNGLGWAMTASVLNVEGELPPGSFGHTGFTGSYALSIPSRDLDVVLLTNRQNFGVDSTGRYPAVGKLRSDVVQAILTELGPTQTGD